VPAGCDGDPAALTAMRPGAITDGAPVSEELGAGQFAVRSHLPAVPVRLAAVVAGSAALAFAALTIWIGGRAHDPAALDLTVHQWVLTHRGGADAAAARAVSWAGVRDVVLAVLLVVGFAAPRRRAVLPRVNAALALLVIAGAGIAAETGINSLIGRGRPPAADWAGAAGGASYPSGHTTAATLLALSCAWALTSRISPGWPRRALFAGAACYALAVGWARVWLGVHWPTDVLAGWLFGLAWTAGAMALMSIMPAAWRWLRRTPG
jgi:membrane-associated phospholipid phosphatase